MDVLVRLREIRRLLRQDRRDRVGRRVAAERALPREHLVEDRPEREDVGPAVGGLAAHLLRRHVAHRAEDDAGLRAGDRAQVRLPTGLVVDLQLRESEVEDLDAPVSGEEQVFGLEIAMDDPFFVRRREPARDLHRVVERLADRNGAGGQALAQRLALEELGDDVRRAVLHAEVVDGRDSRVVQDAGGARLGLEALEPVRVLREGRGQDLDRDLAAQARIRRAVDLAHAARAERREDLVRAEAGSGGEGHAVRPSPKFPLSPRGAGRGQGEGGVWPPARATGPDSKRRSPGRVRDPSSLRSSG